MPKGVVYCTKEDRLPEADKKMLANFRRFFSADIHLDPLSSKSSSSEYEARMRVDARPLSTNTVKELVEALLRYHGWFHKCRQPAASQVKKALVELVKCHTYLHEYGMWLREVRHNKLRSVSKGSISYKPRKKILHYPPPPPFCD
jgi:hypothetical protein